MNEGTYNLNYNQVTQEEMETILMLTRKMDGGDNGERLSPDNDLQEGTYPLHSLITVMIIRV